MFTGLVEEIGKIQKIEKVGIASRIQINAKKISNDLQIDDSVSVNGVCLTVIEVLIEGFIAEAVEETIRKTTLSKLNPGDNVNLERALTLSKRLGGHLVLGHVDSQGKVIEIRKQALGNIIKISYPSEFYKFIVLTGSISIDGVSLTIADYTSSTITLSVIPHTFQNTTINYYQKGTIINLEFDIIGKYVERMVTGKSSYEEKLKEFLNY